MLWAYKIFEDDPGPRTLFHGVRGSRLLPVGKWIDAELKQVTDGSCVRSYLSGFHGYPSLEAVRQWLKGAKKRKGRVVVRVKMLGCWDKPRAVRKTILAKRMMIPVDEWQKRIQAKDF